MTNLTDKQQALLNELLKDFKGDAKDLLGQHGLVKQITIPLLNFEIRL